MSNKYLDIAMEKVIKQKVNDVLDEIRAEIEEQKEYHCFDDGIEIYRMGLNDAIEIINKYRESEDKE